MFSPLYIQSLFILGSILLLLCVGSILLQCLSKVFLGMPRTLQNILFDIGLLSMSSGRWFTHSFTAAQPSGHLTIFLPEFVYSTVRGDQVNNLFTVLFSVSSSLNWLSSTAAIEIRLLFWGELNSLLVSPLFCVSSF